MSEEKKEYGASSIQILEGLEAVRKRPAMYIGDVGVKGLHHLVYEVVDNSIDEALAGHCKNIHVTIHPDNSISVRDDGRGIPTDMHPKEKRSALEVVMTVLHAGGKFDKDSYKVSGGLHGVGVSCVNALSNHLRAEVFRNGTHYMQEYSKGVPQYALKEVGTTEDRGTLVTFTPDDSIFIETTYQYGILEARMRELAFLNKGISITLTDEREKEEDGSFKSHNFYSEGGLKEFVDFIDMNREKLLPEVIHMEGEKNDIPVEVAMHYNTSYNENIHSYVNNINTHEGGTHLAGFRRALTRTLKKYADESGLLAKEKVEVTGDDFREGLTAVISVKVMEPQFERADQDQIGQQRSEWCGRPIGRRNAHPLPRRESQLGQRHCTKGDPCRSGTNCCAQSPRNGAAQRRSLKYRTSRKTERLLRNRSVRVRDLPRGGRFCRPGRPSKAGTGISRPFFP